MQIYGRYPFDVKDKLYAHKFQHAIYGLPPEVPASEACKDLLMRLLVADPAVRISLEDILSHAWFLENLPTGALSMNDHYLSKTSNLSMEVHSGSACPPSSSDCSALVRRSCMADTSSNLQTIILNEDEYWATSAVHLAVDS